MVGRPNDSITYVQKQCRSKSPSYSDAVIVLAAAAHLVPRVRVSEVRTAAKITM